MSRLCMLFSAFIVSLSFSAPAQKVLPIPPEPFAGDIQLRASDSTPDWPDPVKPPAGAPNVLLVMLDDVGFGASSTFGGLVHTPTLDSLAQSGLRYTRFHTTALCSPTRAALLTGRNHHTVHTGVIMEQATGYPGYDSLMKRDTATIGEILKLNGYSTAWIGKNHNVPDWHTSQVGPFELWPTGLGFEYFYGFVGGDTNQWRPAAYEGTKPIEPYLGKTDYNLDYDLADQAVKWVKMQKTMAPDKPFFLYYVPGATHAPHHPKPEWVQKYTGQFAMGWEAARQQIFDNQKNMGILPPNAQLTPIPPGTIPAWDTLPQENKDLYAYMMEIYAGYLEQTDYNVGRVIDAIEEMGQLDNTLIIYICGDNGASPEGTPNGVLNEMTTLNLQAEDFQQVLAHQNDLGTTLTYNHYPVGWAYAMCTPYQWTKQVASHFGGTRNGMVISWPARIKAQGQIRTQFHHVIDIVPTILDVVGLPQPKMINGTKQKPMEGISMAYTFDDAAAASRRRTQYFEMFGNRAMYQDGWIACTTPPTAPWMRQDTTPDVIDDYQWELYNLENDFTEAQNVAAQYPAKLKSLKDLFYRYAAKHNILPLENSRTERLNPALRPSLTQGKTSFVYYDGMARIPEATSPDVKNRSWTMTADIEILQNGDAGVIVTQGGLFAGYALYVFEGKAVFDYNNLGMEHTRLVGPTLSVGTHQIIYDFVYDGVGLGGGGNATLLVDGVQVDAKRIPATVPQRYSLDEGFDVGCDNGTPVCLDYDVPFDFTGKISQVTYQLKEQVPVTSADKGKVAAGAKLRREAE